MADLRKRAEAAIERQDAGYLAPEDADALRRENARLKHDLLSQTRINRAHEARQNEIEDALGIAAEIRNAPPPSRTIKFRGTKGAKPACPVFVASDWHLEERVDSQTLNGVNEYTPDIAIKRADAFFQSCVSLAEMFRQTFAVKQAVLALLGDFITGHIHEDLKLSSAMTPVEAILFCEDLLIPGIEFLFDHAGVGTLHVPCQHGNHGRATPYKLIAKSAETSFEWLMYHHLASYFRASGRDVRFYVSQGYFCHLDIFGMRTRFHHGDWVRYLGGVGGLTIPLNKAIAQWNKAATQAADLDVLGHFHTAFDGGNFIENGSLIGYNAYAQSIKASPEPPQQVAFLVHPHRGKGSTYRVWVTPETKNAKQPRVLPISQWGKTPPPGAF